MFVRRTCHKVIYDIHNVRLVDRKEILRHSTLQIVIHLYRDQRILLLSPSDPPRLVLFPACPEIIQ